MHLLSTVPSTFTREMGYIPQEFMQTLPRALHGYDFTLQQSGATIQVGSHRVFITISEEKQRIIAMMRLPYIEVTFDLAAMDAEQRFTLMKQFDLYFKKGGG